LLKQGERIRAGNFSVRSIKQEKKMGPWIEEEERNFGERGFFPDKGGSADRRDKGGRPNWESAPFFQEGSF